MKQLNPNWLTEGWVDFEYKKYLLLAYLQKVSIDFDERKLKIGQWVDVKDTIDNWVG